MVFGAQSKYKVNPDHLFKGAFHHKPIVAICFIQLKSYLYFIVLSMITTDTFGAFDSLYFLGSFTHLAYYLFALAVLANSLVISLYLKRSIHRLILLVVIFLLYTLSTALIYLLLDFY